MASILGSVANGVKSAVSTVAGEPVRRTVDIVQGVLDVAKAVTTRSVGGVPTDALGDFAELIRMQIEVQKEMQTVTMVSNIEKSKHESKMAALRNVRAA